MLNSSLTTNSSMWNASHTCKSFVRVLHTCSAKYQRCLSSHCDKALLELWLFKKMRNKLAQKSCDMDCESLSFKVSITDSDNDNDKHLFYIGATVCWSQWREGAKIRGYLNMFSYELSNKRTRILASYRIDGWYRILDSLLVTRSIHGIEKKKAW